VSRAGRGRRVRWALTAALVLTLAVGAAAVGAARWSAFMASDVVPGDLPRSVTVERGASPASVIRSLTASGMVSDSPLWRWAIRLERTGACLQRGRHELPGDATPRELLRALCGPGMPESVRLTLPEGWTLWELADAAEALGLGGRGEILALAGVGDGVSPEPLRTFAGALRPTAEALLFADTYEVPVGERPDTWMPRLRARFDEVWSEVATAARLAALQARYGVDAWDVLIVASLVEREAKVAEERPRIARVFYNRLAARMPMQSDPTCTYGAATYAKVPTPALCRDPMNPYSTYRIPRLPPTPIGAVGRSSLLAALEPADEPGLLYFVAMQDGSGRHAFAKSYDEHRRNIETYLKRPR
jgi:UPF0755 protein